MSENIWRFVFSSTIGFPFCREIVNVGRGEIDILAVIDGIRSVVEVRSVRQGREPVDPISAFNESKSRQVRYLAGRLGAGRVDLVTVSFSPAGVDLHWLPWAA